MSNCQTISIEELKTIMQQESVVIVDIREPEEYQREHIDQAQSVPLSHFSADKIDAKGDQSIVFHCQSGNRTKQAVNQLGSTPHAKHYILTGGLSAWKQSGGKTVVDKKAPLPIMRQVQIVVGTMVLLGVILGYAISPYFYWISAFFGGGLLFAGISGTCALASVLMRLPYNRSR